MCRKILPFLLILLFVQGMFCQKVKWEGLIQPVASYADMNNRFGYELGFSMKRMRISPYGSVGSKVDWKVTVSYDEAIARLLDAYVHIRLTDNVGIKAGQFPVPGAASGGSTCAGDLDFIERAAITGKWDNYSRLSVFRTIGVQVDGNLMDRKVKYALMIANPRSLRLFSPSIKDPFSNDDSYGFSVWGNLRVSPVRGLEFGTFFGSTVEDDTHIKRNSYGAHLYYLKGPWKARVEYIAGENDIVSGSTRYDGVYAVLGYRWQKFEFLIRYGFYTPIADSVSKDGVRKFNNITLGVNYFFNKNLKILANYAFRNEIMAAGFEEYSNNIFYISTQMRF